MRINRRKTQIKKILSGLIAFLFLFQDVVGHAAIDLSVQSKTDFKSLYVPQDIGIVKESQIQPASDVIVNVKDIHDNFGAQQSIVQILENLVVNYNVRTIGMEGVEGFVDTSLLAALPDDNFRLKTANHMMQEGKLSAGEFFSAVSGGRIAVYGMDDEKLYEKNLEAFKQNLKNKSKNYAAVDRLRSVLARFEDTVYSEDLRNLNENGVLSRNGNLKFSDRWKEISSMADRLGVAYRDYPNVQHLLKVMDMETRIDFERTNSERETLMDVLSKVLEREKLEKLVLESVSYKMGKISQGSFSSFVLEMARATSVETSVYPNLAKYAEYMMAYEAVDIDALKDEVGDLEDKLREKVFRNSRERELYTLTKQCDILKDLFEVKLSSASLAYFKKNSGAFKADAFKKYIAEESARLKVPVDSALDVDAIFAGIAEAMQFYELAEERNHMILANTIRKMKADGQTVACLVTGGFHTRGITQLMKENRTSYIVILPRFSKKSTRPYLTIITNNESSYKKFAESEYALQAKHEITAHFFAQVAFQEAGKNSYDNDWEKNTGVQKEVTRMKMLYLNAFNALKRSYKEQGMIKEASAAVPTGTSEAEIVSDDHDQSSPDAHAIRTHLLPLDSLVVQSMQLAYAERRVFVLFTADNGKKYLYILNWDKEDQTARVEKTTTGQDAAAEFKNAEAVVGAAEENLNDDKKLEALARELASKGLLSAQEMERIARRRNISIDETKVQDLITEFKGQTDKEAAEAKVAKKVLKHKEAKAAREARKEEKTLRQLELKKLKEASDRQWEKEEADKKKRDAASVEREAQRQGTAKQIAEDTRKRRAIDSLINLPGAVSASADARPLLNALMRLFDPDQSGGYFSERSFGASLVKQDAATIEAFSVFMQALIASSSTGQTAMDTARQLIAKLITLNRSGRDILFAGLRTFVESRQLSSSSEISPEDIRINLVEPVFEAERAQKQAAIDYQKASLLLKDLAQGDEAAFRGFRRLLDLISQSGISSREMVALVREIIAFGKERAPEILASVSNATDLSQVQGLLAVYQKLTETRGQLEAAQAVLDLERSRFELASQRTGVTKNARINQTARRAKIVEDRTAKVQKIEGDIAGLLEQIESLKTAMSPKKAEPVVVSAAEKPATKKVESSTPAFKEAETQAPKVAVVDNPRKAFLDFMRQHSAAKDEREKLEGRLSRATSNADELSKLYTGVSQLVGPQGLAEFSKDLFFVEVESRSAWTYEEILQLLDHHTKIAQADRELPALSEAQDGFRESALAVRRLQAQKTLASNQLRVLLTSKNYPTIGKFLRNLEATGNAPSLISSFWRRFESLQTDAETNFFIERAASLGDVSRNDLDRRVQKELFEGLATYRKEQVEKSSREVTEKFQKETVRKQKVEELEALLNRAGVATLMKAFTEKYSDPNELIRLVDRLSKMEKLSPELLYEVLDTISNFKDFQKEDFQSLLKSLVSFARADMVIADPSRFISEKAVMDRYASSPEVGYFMTFQEAIDIETDGTLNLATRIRDRAGKRILFLLNEKMPVVSAQMPIVARYPEIKQVLETLWASDLIGVSNRLISFVDATFGSDNAAKKERFAQRAMEALQSEKGRQFPGAALNELMYAIRERMELKKTVANRYREARRQFKLKVAGVKDAEQLFNQVVRLGKGRTIKERKQASALLEKLALLDAGSLSEVKKNLDLISKEGLSNIEDLQTVADHALNISRLRREEILFASSAEDKDFMQTKIAKAQITFRSFIRAKRIEKISQAAPVKAFADFLDRLDLLEAKERWFQTILDLDASEQQLIIASLSERTESMISKYDTMGPMRPLTRILRAVFANKLVEAAIKALADWRNETENYRASLQRIEERVAERAKGTRKDFVSDLKSEIESKIQEKRIGRKEATQLLNDISALEPFLLTSFINDLSEVVSLDEVQFLLARYDTFQKNSDQLSAPVMAQIAKFKSQRDEAKRNGLENNFHALADALTEDAAEKIDFWGRLLETWASLDTDQKKIFKPELGLLLVALRAEKSLAPRRELVERSLNRLKTAAAEKKLFEASMKMLEKEANVGRLTVVQRKTITDRLMKLEPVTAAPDKAKNETEKDVMDRYDVELTAFSQALRSLSGFEESARAFFLDQMALDAPITLDQFSGLIENIELIQESPRRIVALEKEEAEQQRLLNQWAASLGFEPYLDSRVPELQRLAVEATSAIEAIQAEREESRNVLKIEEFRGRIKRFTSRASYESEFSDRGLANNAVTDRLKENLQDSLEVVVSFSGQIPMGDSKAAAFPALRDTKGQPETSYLRGKQGTDILPVQGGNILITGQLAETTTTIEDIAVSITTLGITDDPSAASSLASWFKDQAESLVASRTDTGTDVLARVQLVTSSSVPAYFSEGVIHMDLEAIRAILSRLAGGQGAAILEDFMDYAFHHERGHHDLEGLNLFPEGTPAEKRSVEEREVLKRDAAYLQSQDVSYHKNVMKALSLLKDAGYDVTAYLSYLEALDLLRRAADDSRREEAEAGRRSHGPPPSAADRFAFVTEPNLKFHLLKLYVYIDDREEADAQEYFQKNVLPLIERQKTKVNEETGKTEEIGEPFLLNEDNKPTNHVDTDNTLKELYKMVKDKGPTLDGTAKLRRLISDSRTGAAFLETLRATYAKTRRYLINLGAEGNFSRADIEAVLIGVKGKVGVDQKTAAEFIRENQSNLNSVLAFFSSNEYLTQTTMDIGGRTLLTKAVEEALIALQRETDTLALLREVSEKGGKKGQEALLEMINKANNSRQGAIFTLEIGDRKYFFHQKVFDEIVTTRTQILRIEEAIEEDDTAITDAEKKITADTQAMNLAPQEDGKNTVALHYQMRIRDTIQERDKTRLHRFRYRMELYRLLARVGIKTDRLGVKIEDLQKRNLQELADLEKQYGSLKALEAEFTKGYNAEAGRLSVQTQRMLEALALVSSRAEDTRQKLEALLSEDLETHEIDMVGQKDQSLDPRKEFFDSRIQKLTQDESFALFNDWLAKLGVASPARVAGLFSRIQEGYINKTTLGRWFEELAETKRELDRLTMLSWMDEAAGKPENSKNKEERHKLRRQLETGIGKTVSLAGLLEQADRLKKTNVAEKIPAPGFEAEEDAKQKADLAERTQTTLDRSAAVLNGTQPELQDLMERVKNGQEEIGRAFDKPRALVTMYGIRDAIDAEGKIIADDRLLQWAVRSGLMKIDDSQFMDDVEAIGDASKETGESKARVSGYLKESASDLQIYKNMIYTAMDQKVGSETFLSLWQREKSDYLSKVQAVDKDIQEELAKRGLKQSEAADTEEAIQVLTEVYKNRFAGSIDSQTGKLAEDKIVEFIAFITESSKLAFGYKSLKPDQLIMLGLFMGWKSAGLLAGGGKTVIYPLYHVIARAVVGNEYHGMVIAESSDGVRGFTVRAMDKRNSLRDLFRVFGMTLENGTELFESRDASGMKKLIEKLEDPNSLVVIDKTSRAHVNNNSEEDPALRRALNRLMVTTVDEVHLFSTDRDAALLSKGTREADLDNIQNVQEIIKEIYDKNTGKFDSSIVDNDSLTADPKKSLGQIVIKTEKEYREAHAKYRDTDKGEHTKVIFQRGEEVFISLALEKYLQEKLGITSNKIIASTIRGLLKIQERGKAGGWAVTETKEGSEWKEVIAPIGHDGSIKETSIISDIHYQAVLALEAKNWNAEEARKLVRVSDSSTQVAITDALQTDTGTRVMGASGTVQEIEDPIQATTDSEVVNINASKSQLDTYTARSSRKEMLAEIERTVRGERDGIARGALVAAYDIDLIQEIRAHFESRGIRVRVMGSISDDIADIVDKAGELSADDTGTVTIFNQRGMTGRSYRNAERTAIDENGNKMLDEDGKEITFKVGLDLFHMEMGDEQSTELLFNQTTARNRRSIADGERFYLWDAKAESLIRDRVNDLFGPENRQLKDEVIQKLKESNSVKQVIKTAEENPQSLSEEEKAFLFMFDKLRSGSIQRIGGYEEFSGELLEAVVSEEILGEDRIRSQIEAALAVKAKDRNALQKRLAGIHKTLTESRDTRRLSTDEADLVESLLGIPSLDSLRQNELLGKKAEARYRNGLILLNQKYLTIREVNESVRFMVQDTSWTRFVVEPIKEALRVVRKDKRSGDEPSEIETILQVNLESALRRESDYVQLLLGSTEREKGFEYTQGVILSAIQQAEATFESLLASSHAKEIDSLIGATLKKASLKEARRSILDSEWDQDLTDREPLKSFAQAKREARGDYAKLVEYTYRASQELQKKKMISKIGRQSHIISITRFQDTDNKAEIQVKAYGEINQENQEDDETKKETAARKKKEPKSAELRAKIALTAFTDGFQAMIAKNPKMMRVLRPGATGTAVLIGNAIHITVTDEFRVKTVSTIEDPDMVRVAKQMEKSGNGAFYSVEIQKGEGENEGGLNISFTHLPSKIKRNQSFTDAVIMGDVNAHILHSIISFGGPGDGPRPKQANIYPSTIAAMAVQLDMSEDDLIARITRGLKAYHSIQNAKMLVTDLLRDPKKRGAFLKANKAAIIEKLGKKEWYRWKRLSGNPSHGLIRSLAISYLSWTVGQNDLKEIRTVDNYENLADDYKRLMDQILKDVSSVDDPQFYGFLEKNFMRLYWPVRQKVAKAYAKDPAVVKKVKDDKERERITKQYDDDIKAQVKAIKEDPRFKNFPEDFTKMQEEQVKQELEKEKQKALAEVNETVAGRMLTNMDSEKLRGLLQKIDLKEEILGSLLGSANKDERFFGGLLKRLKESAQGPDLGLEFEKQYPSGTPGRTEAWRDFQSRALMLGLGTEELARVNLRWARTSDPAADLHEDFLSEANEIAKLTKNKPLQDEIRAEFVKHLEEKAQNAKELELGRILRRLENIRDESGRVLSGEIGALRTRLRQLNAAADPLKRKLLNDVSVASSLTEPSGWSQINRNTTLSDLETLTGYKAEEIRQAIMKHFGETAIFNVFGPLDTVLTAINGVVDKVNKDEKRQLPSVSFEELRSFITDFVRIKKGRAIADELEDGPTALMIEQGDALAIEFQKIQTLLEKYDVYKDGAERLSNAARHIGSKGFLLREGRARFGFETGVEDSTPERIELFFTHILTEWAEREQYHDNSDHDDTLTLVAARVADPELGSLAAQILKNRFSTTSSERLKDFGNIASNLKTVIRRDNKLRPTEIDFEGGLDISDGKLFMHTYEVVSKEERSLEDHQFGPLGRTVTTRVLSRIDTAAKDRGNNVSQNNGDHTISHFRSKTGGWNDTETRGVLTGEKSRMLALIVQDLARIRKNDPGDPSRLIKITKSGGVDFINLNDAQKFKDSAEALRMIAYKARVTGYRDANPKDRDRLLNNLDKVVDFEASETRMKMAFFNQDLGRKDKDLDRKLNEWEFQQFVDGWMHDLDIHEVQHELDNVTGRSAYWHKKYKGEDGIRRREIDAHLISIAKGRNPYSVLTQVTTYISRGSSGIGYRDAGSDILRYIIVNLASQADQDRVKAAAKAAKPSDYEKSLKKGLWSDPEETAEFLSTNPKAVADIGYALSQVSKDQLQAAALKGWEQFLADGDDNKAPQVGELSDVVRTIMEGQTGIDEEAFQKSMLTDPEFRKQIEQKIPEIQRIYDQEIANARERGYGVAVDYLELLGVKFKVEKYAYRAVKDNYQFVGAQIRGELHTLYEMLKRSANPTRLMNYADAKDSLPENYLKLEQEANENKLKALGRIREWLERANIPESLLNTVLSDTTRAFLSKSAYREVPFYTEGKTVDKGSTAAYSFDSFELVVVATEEDPTKDTTADFRHVLNHEIQHFNIDIANEKIREAIVELIALLNNRWRGEASDQYQDVLRRLGAQEGEYRKFMDFAKKNYKDFSYEALVYAQMTGDLSILGLYSLEGAIAAMDFEVQKNPKMKIRTNYNFTAKTPNRLGLKSAVTLESLKALEDEDMQSLAGVVFTLDRGKGGVVLKHVHGKPVPVGDKKRQKDEPIKPREIGEAQKPIKNLAVPPPPKDEEDKAKLPAWIRRPVVVRFGSRFLALKPDADTELNGVHQIGGVYARPLTDDKQRQLDQIGGPRQAGETWYLLTAAKKGSASERAIAVAKIKQNAAGRIEPTIAVQPIADKNGNTLSKDQIKRLMTHPLADGRFAKYLASDLGRAETILDQTAPLLFSELRDWVLSRRYSGPELNARYEGRAQEIADEVADRRGFVHIQVVFPAKGAEIRSQFEPQMNPVALNIAGPRGATHGLATEAHPVGKDANGRDVNGPYKFDGPLGAIVETLDETGQVRQWVVVSDNTLQVILGKPDDEDKAMTYLTEAAVRVQEDAIRGSGHLLGGDQALSAFARRNKMSILFEGNYRNHKEGRVLLPAKKYPDTPEGRRSKNAEVLKAMHADQNEEGRDEARNTPVKEGESFSVEPFLVSGKDPSGSKQEIYWTGDPQKPVYISEAEVDRSDLENLRHKISGEEVHRWETVSSAGRKAYTIEKTYRAVKDDKGRLHLLDTTALDLGPLEVSLISLEPTAPALLAFPNEPRTIRSAAARLSGISRFTSALRAWAAGFRDRYFPREVILKVVVIPAFSTALPKYLAAAKQVYPSREIVVLEGDLDSTGNQTRFYDAFDADGTVTVIAPGSKNNPNPTIFSFYTQLAKLEGVRDRVVNKLEEIPGSKVLSIGEGPGHLGVAVEKRGNLKFDAIDISPLNVKRSIERARKARVSADGFKVGNAYALDEAYYGKYDQVIFPISVGGLEPAKLWQAFGEARKALTPGGRILILALSMDTEKEEHTVFDDLYHSPSKQKLKNDLIAAGFDEDSIKVSEVFKEDGPDDLIFIEAKPKQGARLVVPLPEPKIEPSVQILAAIVLGDDDEERKRILASLNLKFQNVRFIAAPDKEAAKRSIETLDPDGTVQTRLVVDIRPEQGEDRLDLISQTVRQAVLEAQKRQTLSVEAIDPDFVGKSVEEIKEILAQMPDEKLERTFVAAQQALIEAPFTAVNWQNFLDEVLSGDSTAEIRVDAHRDAYEPIYQTYADRFSGLTRELIESQLPHTQNIKAIRATKILSSDGNVDPLFARAAGALKEILTGNLYLYSYSGPEARRIRERLDQAGLGWLEVKEVAKVQSGPLLQALKSQIPMTDERPFTLSLGEDEYERLDASAIRPDIADRYVITPSGVGALQELGLAILAQFKKESLIVVKGKDQTFFDEILRKYPWLLPVTLPMKLFEEIRQAINSLRQSEIAA